VIVHLQETIFQGFLQKQAKIELSDRKNRKTTPIN
jgi:hypothetical protein